MLLNKNKFYCKLNKMIIDEEFDVDFWFTFNKMPLTEKSFEFLFEVLPDGETRMLKICYSLDIEKTRYLHDSINLYKTIEDITNKLASSKFMASSHQLEIFSYHQEYSNYSYFELAPSAKRKGAYDSHFLDYFMNNIISKSKLSDESFNFFLPVFSTTLIRNENLTVTSFNKLIDKLLENNGGQLHYLDAEDMYTSKPKTLKIDVDQRWDVLKACFNLDDEKNFKKLNPFLQGVDVETFKTLETSWPGSLNDLIEASIFNGPDK